MIKYCKKNYIMISVLLSWLIIIPSYPIQAASTIYYGQKLCNSEVDLYCIVVKKGDTWRSLWPDDSERNQAMAINRMTITLRPGMELVSPQDTSPAILESIFPFPQEIGQQNARTIMVSRKNLVWAAYETDGKLVRWGPASTGRVYCPDTDEECTTPLGTFFIYRKSGEKCVSSKYPVPKGGAPTPFCMFFVKGYAIHGSYSLPGYNASHGCVRTTVADSQWLNQKFISVGITKVIINDM